MLSLSKIFQFASCQSLKLTPNKTNFFDVHIKDEKECLDLCIMTKEGQKIWDVNIQSGNNPQELAKLSADQIFIFYILMFCLCSFR